MRKFDNSTNSEALLKRIKRNTSHQEVNINEWAFTHIVGFNDKLKILELCSGTGNQTEYLLTKFPNSVIKCLDISLESLEVLKKKFVINAMCLNLVNEKIDDFFRNNEEKFDIIFCSYGLYYADNIDFVLDKIYSSIADSGRLIVMGPYGDNNKEIFDLTIQSGAEIPPFVLFTSSGFMNETVENFCKKKKMKINIVTTKNKIKWDNVNQVTDYWKNSTFYSENCGNKFNELVVKKIQKTGLFINTKHIMLLDAQKFAI